MIKVYPHSKTKTPPPTLDEIKQAIETARVSIETKVTTETAKVVPKP